MRSQKNKVPAVTHSGIANRFNRGILTKPKQTTPKLPLAGKLAQIISNFS
jgi:hypothetical protein